jgi:hypothetical protein
MLLIFTSVKVMLDKEWGKSWIMPDNGNILFHPELTETAPLLM